MNQQNILVDEDTAQNIVYQAPHSVDGILSQDLFNLSLKDRNAIDEEIHGVTNLAPKESPDFLEDALRKLSKELHNLPDGSKDAYLESQILPETFVNTPDFRLRFLRCELFDAHKAAARMARYLDLASDLFGPVALERPVRLSDFTKEEMSYMVNANTQLVPFRDRSGRPVYFFHGYEHINYPDIKLKNRLRCSLFLYTATSNDLETQQKGAVGVLYGTNIKHQKNRSSSDAPKWKEFLADQRILSAIPVRFVAAHFCYPNTPYFHSIRAAYAILLPGKRTVMKFHIGERIEQLYNLQTYGIPVEWLPIVENTNFRRKFWQQWINGRKLIEEKNDKSVILFPGSNDVLFRKGTSLTCHPGNALYRGYIESRMQEHSAASQTEKKAITTLIIDTVHQKGGRFLEWTKKGWWVELVDASTIHKKVANQVKLFRRKPSASSAQRNRSSTVLFSNQDHAKFKRRKIDHDSNSDSEASACDCACFSFQ